MLTDQLLDRADDVHATILHLLRSNHEKLTYRYAGRDCRVSNTEDEVIMKIRA